MTRTSSPNGARKTVEKRIDSVRSDMFCPKTEVPEFPDVRGPILDVFRIPATRSRLFGQRLVRF